MAGTMGRFVYTSDDTVAYRIRQDVSNAAAAGNVSSALPPNLPGRYKPRYILAAHPTSGRERKIVIGDPTNAMWVGGTTTISLPDFAAAMAATSFLVRGRVGERRLA
jgi:hypothetical protein